MSSVLNTKGSCSKGNLENTPIVITYMIDWYFIALLKVKTTVQYNNKFMYQYTLEYVLPVPEILF